MDRLCQYCQRELHAQPDGLRTIYACSSEEPCPNGAPFMVSSTEEAIEHGFWTLPKDEQVRRLERARKLPRARADSLPLVTTYG